MGNYQEQKNYCKRIDFRPLKGLIALTFKLIRDIYHGGIGTKLHLMNEHTGTF